MASRGLRRGEGCGLRRSDTDLSVALTTVRWQIIQLGWKTVQGAPKSGAGDRTIALDAGTVADVRRHRREQDTERKNAGDAWAGSGFEFTDGHGGPLHPADVTYAFHMIAYLAGLPPVRLHDLRHGAATLLQRRGVASGATFRARREDDAVGDAGPGPAGRLTRPQSEAAGQSAVTGRCWARCRDVASSLVASEPRMMQQKQRKSASTREDADIGRPSP